VEQGTGDPAASRLAELRSSARGWHGVQLAVLGFIGFCGVLQKERPANPQWVQTAAAVLALAALVVACFAAFQVGRVAWPLYSARQIGPETPDDVALAGRQLRSGLLLTFAAIAMLALATASGWWPTDEESSGQQVVQVRAADGQTWCGRLTTADSGSLGVDTADGPVVVPIEQLAAVNPVSGCS
jgi:hypothetical protein